MAKTKTKLQKRKLSYAELLKAYNKIKKTPRPRQTTTRRKAKISKRKQGPSRRNETPSRVKKKSPKRIEAKIKQLSDVAYSKSKQKRQRGFGYSVKITGTTKTLGPRSKPTKIEFKSTRFAKKQRAREYFQSDKARQDISKKFESLGRVKQNKYQARVTFEFKRKGKIIKAERSLKFTKVRKQDRARAIEKFLKELDTMASEYIKKGYSDMNITGYTIAGFK